MAADSLERSARLAFEEDRHYSLSVFSFEEETAEAIARHVRALSTDDLPQNRLRACTVARVREAGYEVVLDEPPPGHAAILLPNPPQDADWNNLDMAFDPPIINPVARSHRE